MGAAVHLGLAVPASRLGTLVYLNAPFVGWLSADGPTGEPVGRRRVTQWYLAYVIALCGLAATAAMLHEAQEQQRPRLVRVFAGIAILAAVSLALAVAPDPRGYRCDLRGVDWVPVLASTAFGAGDPRVLRRLRGRHPAADLRAAGAGRPRRGCGVRPRRARRRGCRRHPDDPAAPYRGPARRGRSAVDGVDRGRACPGVRNVGTPVGHLLVEGAGVLAVTVAVAATMRGAGIDRTGRGGGHGGRRHDRGAGPVQPSPRSVPLFPVSQGWPASSALWCSLAVDGGDPRRRRVA